MTYCNEINTFIFRAWKIFLKFGQSQVACDTCDGRPHQFIISLFTDNNTLLKIQEVRPIPI